MGGQNSPPIEDTPLKMQIWGSIDVNFFKYFKNYLLLYSDIISKNNFLSCRFFCYWIFIYAWMGRDWVMIDKYNFFYLHLNSYQLKDQI